MEVNWRGWWTLALTYFLAASVAGDGKQERTGCFHHPANGGSIYSFDEEDLFGKANVSLSQFEGQQEPGATGKEIYNGIKYVRPGEGFEPEFPLFKRIEVNGEKEHPLYTYLKSSCPPTRNYYSTKEKLNYAPIKVNDIRWNWEKFLITKRGKPYMRYDPSTNPSQIKSDVEFLLLQDP